MNQSRTAEQIINDLLDSTKKTRALLTKLDRPTNTSIGTQFPAIFVPKPERAPTITAPAKEPALVPAEKELVPVR
jgi:hypothetical protein